MDNSPSQSRENPLTLSLTIAVLVAVLVNLLLTAILFTKVFTQPSEAAAAHHSVPLPKELSSAKRQELFNQLQGLYNAQDTNGLYNILAKEAQLQLTRQNVAETLVKLRKTFGNIEDGTYSHYRFLSETGGKQAFVLIYTVRFADAKTFSSKGTCRMTVAVSEGQVEIYGFYIGSVSDSED